MILLDTDVTIDLLKGVPSVQRRLEELLPEEGFHFSVVTVAEVLCGGDHEERAAAERLFQVNIIHSVEYEIARKAAEYRRLYRQEFGTSVTDAMIAATAYTLKLQLFTRNRRHFPMKDIELV